MVDRQTLTIATAERAYPGATVSGDAFQVDWHAARCRIAVIDGLGHGPLAAAAADAAKTALAAHPELAPTAALLTCHDALRATRGAAMWVGSIDLESRRLVYAGVGNVDGLVWQNGDRFQVVGQRGIVGAAMPTLREFERPVTAEWLLVVHTDGIRAHSGSEALAELLRQDPQSLVDGLLQEWGRATDDALILAARLT